MARKVKNPNHPVVLMKKLYKHLANLTQTNFIAQMSFGEEAS